MIGVPVLHYRCQSSTQAGTLRVVVVVDVDVDVDVDVVMLMLLLLSLVTVFAASATTVTLCFVSTVSAIIAVTCQCLPVLASACQWPSAGSTTKCIASAGCQSST
jgi:hypothetical protein